MKGGDFNTYLRDYGFSVGTELGANEYRSLYKSWELGKSPAWDIVKTRAAQPQQQDSGGGGMGGAMGLGKSLMGGKDGQSSGMGGSWGGAASGAMQGAMAGHMNYQNDPNMSNKKDGFGTHYRDNRAEVGGAVLGGVMGYYGLGELAGPAVTAAHPVMEPTTRWLINTGDSFGGAGGALMMDPIGTVSSGKYSGEQLAWGAALGPAAKWFGLA